MSVFRVRRNGDLSGAYICEMVIHGKRIQKSTGQRTKTAAQEWEQKERRRLERASGGLTSEEHKPGHRSVAEVIEKYLDDYKIGHRPKSIAFTEGRLKQVKRLLGRVLLADLTEDRIRHYIRTRQNESQAGLAKNGGGTSGRTINMELGELSRAVGRTWKELWPKVKKLEERKDIGRALLADEQSSLLRALETSQSQTLRTLIPLLLLTGMRVGEATDLSWSRINLIESEITVGRAKTSSGTGRIIPIVDDLARIFAEHRAWYCSVIGEPGRDDYVFPFKVSERRYDPTRHLTSLKRSWTELRKRAQVSCRMHDFRHTFATMLAEKGVPESVMLALMGHMSRAMLERYSHIRKLAKVKAMADLSLWPKREIIEMVPVKVPVFQPLAEIQ